jgi:integrase/recombinase XerD
MKQAKVPTDIEMKRLLAVIANGRHAGRNRIALALSFYAGMRVGEIASLKATDVFDDAGNVRDAIRLHAENTKANEARAVFVSVRLRKEIMLYVADAGDAGDRDGPLLLTQKRTAFSANTLCQLFGQLYKQAGIDGASSHSGRRSFISKLAHNGVSPKVIMTLAGHKHMTTTQRYIDVNDEMMRRAVNLV